MHEIQEKATTHKVFMKIIRPWPRTKRIFRKVLWFNLERYGKVSL